MILRRADHRGAVQRDFRPFAKRVGDGRHALLRKHRANRHQLFVIRRHGQTVLLQHVRVDVQRFPVQTNGRQQDAAVAFRHGGHLSRAAVRRGGEQFVYADQLLARQAAAHGHDHDIRRSAGNHVRHLLKEQIILQAGVILDDVAGFFLPRGDDIHISLRGEIHIGKRGERGYGRACRQSRTGENQQAHQRHQHTKSFAHWKNPPCYYSPRLMAF